MASIALIKPYDDKMVDSALDMPQNLLEIGSYLEKEHEVEIVDLCIDNSQSIPSGMDFYGFSVITSTYYSAIKEIQKLREREKQAKIIGGGRHFWYCDDYNHFDFIIKGEGHKSLRAILNNSNDDSIKVIESYNGFLGSIDFSLIEVSKYIKRCVGKHLGIGILLNRGCPFKCSFCSCDSLFIDRPIEYIEAMLKQLCIFTKYLRVVDDNFVCHRDFKSISKLIDRNFDGWSCLVRGDMLPKVASFLQDNGCISVQIGIESGSNEILSRMNKQETIEEIINGIQIAREHNLYVRGSIVVGFPFETDDDIEDTIKVLNRVAIDDLSIHRFVPFPGSYVYNNPQKFGITFLSENYNDYVTTGRIETESFRTKTINASIISQRVDYIKSNLNRN